MIDYKLVPKGPTPEWIANLKRVRIGRMESVIEDVLAAAPAVQGEPVGHFTGEFSAVVEGPVEFRVRAYGRLPKMGAKLYLAPQPAEQERLKRFNGQECWMWAGDGSDRLETLTCPVVITPADLMAIINRGSPAPDVEVLVEALELARRTLAMAALEGEVTRRIDSALAAHRKQGGDQS